MAVNKRWQYLIFFLLAVFVALVPFDWFLGQYRYLGTLIGLHTMVIVGLCLVMGYTGQVSLGQAAFFGTGMYTSAILTSEYDYNAWVAMVIGAAGTAALALVLAPIFRLRGNYLALATLAVGYIVWKLASIDEWDHTGGPDGIRGIPYLSIGGFEFDSDFRRYFLVWGICFVILLLSQNIVNSRIGRALRAIHGSEDAAEALGINILWFKVKIFVLGAVFASIAGSLFAHHQLHASPGYFTPVDSVEYVVMAVVGGLASIWGAIFGTATIDFLNKEVLIHYGHWNVAIEGLIVVLIMMWYPEGLFVAIKTAYQRDGIWFVPKLLWYAVAEVTSRIRRGLSPPELETEHTGQEIES